MKVSTVGCTSLRPSQSTFKAREDEDYNEYASAHNPSPSTIVKKIIIAGSVATAGTLMTKGISAKLLSKIKNDSVFAEKIGKKTLEAYNYVSAKVAGLDSTKKVQKEVKKFAEGIIKTAKNFASKGAEEGATSTAKATNGIKKGLSWVAGGATAVESFKNTDGDSLTNGEEVAKAGAKIFEAIITGS